MQIGFSRSRSGSRRYCTAVFVTETAQYTPSGSYLSTVRVGGGIGRESARNQIGQSGSSEVAGSAEVLITVPVAQP